MIENKVVQLRERTGLNRREFCELFEIPYRTVTDWELGNRHAPAYVVRLMEYYIYKEGFIKEPSSDSTQESEESHEKTNEMLYLY